MNAQQLLSLEIVPNNMTLVEVGQLSFPSGKVVVSSPFSLSEVALDWDITPGNYLLKLYYVDCNEWGYRVSLASLNISNNKVTDYVRAIDTYGNDFFFVDAGLSSICDLSFAIEFAGFLDQWNKDNPKSNYYLEFLKDQLVKEEIPGERTNRFGLHFPFKDQRNIAIFECGLGDGTYHFYWGLDNQGIPQKLIINFNILDWD